MALKDDLIPLLQFDADVRAEVRAILLEALQSNTPTKTAVRNAVQTGTNTPIDLTPATVTPALVVKFQAALLARQVSQQAYLEYIVNNLSGAEQRAFGIWFASHL